MSQKECRQAFEARLATWASTRSPSLRVQYENVSFTPIKGETYLKSYLLPAKSVGEDLAGDLTSLHGVFQISIVSPIDTGPGIAQGIADELDAQFYNNLRLSISSFTVQQITPASIAPALQSESSYTLPVSFEYRADT